MQQGRGRSTSKKAALHRGSRANIQMDWDVLSGLNVMFTSKEEQENGFSLLELRLWQLTSARILPSLRVWELWARLVSDSHSTFFCYVRNQTKTDVVLSWSTEFMSSNCCYYGSGLFTAVTHVFSAPCKRRSRNIALPYIRHGNQLIVRQQWMKLKNNNNNNKAFTPWSPCFAFLCSRLLWKPGGATS